MAEENYKEYLAARVLTDNRPATYRLLSRALKVNVNTAKQMLYEFHSKQNAKKPKSVHATYLLTGKKRSSEHSNGIKGKDGEDTVMRSSPYMSSMPEPEAPAEEPVSKTSIVLAREEELEKTKAEFDEITSIHIYSLEPGPIENLNVLSVCNQEVATEYANEDPLARWRVYGCIHNPYIKRRTTKYNPAPQKPATKPASKPSATTAAKKEETAAPARRGSASEANISGRSTPQPGPTTASLKRSDSKSNVKKNMTAGDIFKSFAKAKPKAKEAEKSKESTPAPAEDEQMQGMSEDEGDADDEPQVQFDKEKAETARKAREEREEKLRKMMEADIEMSDAPPEAENDSQDAPLDKEATSKSAESEATVIVQGGRRRGRRRVMKKKTVKDEDGYLVTKEEPVWESFSEDEPQPKKPKPAPKPASTAKGKKGGKQGQGSIASFFTKG
ncbi:hypothetical protein BU26DRAFT_518989 [Trematosphaeria pertusa]|uniref:DNA polymerase delta subunit 3 n=1 Tax=Trematosphaeria pertusa TaxID=390896 RepID=A0A6A6IEZ3_9PLEO|nr:uncharacterized protein BU26DRAFT_518989 [Trematosphaeria pertusa]KAF2248777.1 hypothetical protein BU26DRAFT_518989 [Trematosphaeria pertusa]